MYPYSFSSAGRGNGRGAMPFLMSFALEPEIVTLAGLTVLLCNSRSTFMQLKSQESRERSADALIRDFLDFALSPRGQGCPRSCLIQLCPVLQSCGQQRIRPLQSGRFPGVNGRAESHSTPKSACALGRRTMFLQLLVLP